MPTLQGRKARSLSWHIRFLRNVTNEATVAFGPILRALGREWDWEREDICFQLLIHAFRPLFYLVPFVLPKTPPHTRLLRPGCVKGFREANPRTSSPQVVRFVSVTLRRHFRIKGGQAYKIRVVQLQGCGALLVQVRNPITWRSI